jgi:hypothetical protein
MIRIAERKPSPIATISLHWADERTTSKRLLGARILPNGTDTEDVLAVAQIKHQVDRRARELI